MQGLWSGLVRRKGPPLGGYWSSTRKKGVQTVGFAHNHIEDIKSLSFKPTKGPLLFRQGRMLLYRHSPSRLAPLLDYWPHLLAAALLGSLLYTKHNFDTLPIIKHVYVGGLFVVAVLTARRYLRNSHVVREIHLMEGGKASEVVFRNQLKRRLFGEPSSELYYNSLFAEPPSEADTVVPPNLLPSELSALTPEQKVGRYWLKRYSNEANYLLIPKQYEFMEADVLQEVMRGKVILS